MRALLTKARADRRGCKLQAGLIAIVVLLSSFSSALALSLLLLADSPFEAAFQGVRGAHLAVAFDSSRASYDQIRSTASVRPVTAAAGPYPSVKVTFESPSGTTGAVVLRVVGRDRPDGSVDRVTVLNGRWAASPGEAVVSSQVGLHVGDTLTPTSTSQVPQLRVVGTAIAVNDPSRVWVVTRQLPSRPDASEWPASLMFYRLRSAATQQDVAAAADAIAAAAPPGSVVATQDWLQFKSNLDVTPSVMVPVLLAFGILALAGAGLIIANVVSGAVIAGRREIGIMKSIGFTPAQVVAVKALEVLPPVAIASAIGIALGILLSQPILAQAAAATGLPPGLMVVPGADAALFGLILVVAATAVVVPTLGVARTSAITALTSGSAPRVGVLSRLSRLLEGLPGPTSIRLGIYEPLIRPARSLTMLLAVTTAVAMVTSAAELLGSLHAVGDHYFRDKAVPVEVFRQTGGDEDIRRLIASQPGTGLVIGEQDFDEVTVHGVAGTPVLTAVRGDSSRLGYSVIRGRWIERPGEAIATPWLLRQANASLGDALTLTVGGHQLRVRVVGTYFKQGGDDMFMLMDWSTLTAAGVPFTPDRYEVSLEPGTDDGQYIYRLSAAAPPGSIVVDRRSGVEKSVQFVSIDALLIWLALILGSVGMAGVFNTVVLNTREKARSIALLKAIGMTPRQTVAMALAPVAILGTVGGLLGIPVGIVLHGRILGTMAEIAARTELPSSLYAVFDPIGLVALAGVAAAISVGGGWVPARRAACAGVAQVLRCE